MQLLASPKGRSRAGALLTALVVAVALATLTPASPAEAQNRDVVDRLVEYGKMSKRQARQLVREVNEALETNAARGGDGYDRIRKAVNKALFGANAGPGKTRQLYFDRLEKVLDRMKQGLTPEMLEQLFPQRPNSSVLCANDFGVTMGACDALVAAASKQPMALPYTPPDDGSALRSELQGTRGINGREAREIVSMLRDLMLGVPKNLTRDAKGRAVLDLVEACPGGLSSREAQIRAWHVGPTPGLARCIVQKMVELAGGARPAAAKLEQWFDIDAEQAQDLLRWGAPDAPQGAASGGGQAQPSRPAPQPSRPAPQPSPSKPEQPSSGQVTAGQAPNPQLAEQWRKHAKGLYKQGRFREAAQAYHTAARANASEPRIFAGLGASRLHAGDPRGAVEAYRRAVTLANDNIGYRIALARALVTSGQRDEAVKVLKNVLLLDGDNQAAKQGLRALGAEPEPPRPQMPETPSRGSIISAMQPLESAVKGCAPSHSGEVKFHLTIEGDSGDVIDARVEGELADTDEGACMLGIVRGASFPRFKKDTLEIAYPYEL